MIRQTFTASRKSFCKTTLRLSSINARLCDDNINSNHTFRRLSFQSMGVPPATKWLHLPKNVILSERARNAFQFG